MSSNKFTFNKTLKSIAVLSVLTFLICSCESNKFKVDLSEKVDIDLGRFEDELLTLNHMNASEKLPELRKKYPKFIPANYQAVAYQKQLIAQVTYPLTQKLFEDKLTYAPLGDKIEKDVEGVLSHYKYYYPESILAEAFTYISGLSRSLDPVMFDSSSVVIAIDHYYGEDYPVYDQSGVYDYQRKLMKAEFLKVDIARFLALNRFAPLKQGANFLETMVYLGKVNYFANAMNPDIEEAELMRFEEKDLQYCKDNAERVWTYFVEKEILYTKDAMIIKKYTEPRPFANSLEKESPGRIGVWFGRQIVDEYVKNENLTLQELMAEEDLLKIFRKAKYRP